MILPGMGIVSEVIPCFARKNLFGYTFVAFSSFGIACLGFLVWAHHMFVAGISMYAALIFSLPELPGRGPLGDQGLQLDGHALQGLDLVRDADAVRAGLRRACSPPAA